MEALIRDLKVLEPLIPKIEVPTMLLWGKQDMVGLYIILYFIITIITRETDLIYTLLVLYITNA